MKNEKYLPLTERTKPIIKQIFSLADSLPNRYQYSIGEQLRRASLSIGLNIAESNGRRTLKERVNFLNISLGSLRETIYILEFISYLDITKPRIESSVIAELEELSKILYVIIQKSNT